MRPAAVALLVLLACIVLATAWTPLLPVVGPVRGEALSPSISLLTNRSFAGRGDAVLFVVWYNLTGSGQVAGAWVNLTFENLSHGPSAFAVENALVTYPGPCVAFSNLSWQCFGLHAGAYLWTIPTIVQNETAVGLPQNVTGYAVTATPSGSMTQNAMAKVLIAGAALSLAVSSHPGLSAVIGGEITYNATVTNRGIDDLLNTTTNRTQQQALVDNSTANATRIAVTLDPGLRFGSGPEGLTLYVGALGPGSSLTLSVKAIVAENATIGSAVGVHVTVTYRDHGYNLTLRSASSPVYVRQAEVFSPGNVIAAAAIALAVIVSALALVYYFGQRRLVIDEAFLMHKSGALIEHVSRSEAQRKDDDLVASMFVAIQEFVKDSFRSQALLDTVSFGGRRAAVVRGQHLVLAAIVSRGDVDYLFPQMVEAVRVVEATSAKLLATWDGRYTKIVGAKGVLKRFVHGGYRRPWKSQIT